MGSRGSPERYCTTRRSTTHGGLPRAERQHTGAERPRVVPSRTVQRRRAGLDLVPESPVAGNLTDVPAFGRNAGREAAAGGPWHVNPFSYTHRLRRDLSRWVDLGWLSETGRAAILDDLDRHEARYKPFTIALGAGIVLVVVGIVAFAGANWDGLDYGLRLLIMLGGMAVLYTAGIAAVARESHRWIPESLFLLAASLFGANVFNIAQMYHISSDSESAAIMLWCAGGLATVWGARSKLTLHLVFVTLLLWTHNELLQFETRQDSGSLIFAALWIAAVITGDRWKWKPLPHYAMVTLLYYVHYLASFTRQDAFSERTALFTVACLVVVVMLWAGAAVSKSAKRAPWLAGHSAIMERYALGAAIAGSVLLYVWTGVGGDTGAFGDAGDFWLLVAAVSVAAMVLAFLCSAGHIPGRDAAGMMAILLINVFQPYLPGGHPLVFWLHAAFSLILVLWLIDFGLRGDPLWRVAGYILFVGHVLHVYARAFGSLLETGLYLILGGLILVAVAVVIRRFDLWAAARAGDRAT